MVNNTCDLSWHTSFQPARVCIHKVLPSTIDVLLVSVEEANLHILFILIQETDPCTHTAAGYMVRLEFHVCMQRSY